MEMEPIFVFDSEKNELLKKERGISFEEIIFCIHNGQVLDVIPHPNPRKYPNQNLYIVNVEGYAYIVPFLQKGDVIVLKTLFPSRRATKKYLESEELIGGVLV